jgi:quercetin dioxygenase-like cupin family protein
MRRFRIEIGGHTLKHKHDYEHMAFVLSGLGTLFASDKEFKLKKGTSLLVHSNELHQFRADRGKHLEFLCLIPK